MVELMQANWIVLVIALVIGLLVAWLVFARSRRTRVESAPTDEAPETAGPRRNQALIDAPPAAAPAASQPLAATPVAATPVADRAQSAAEMTRVMPRAAPMGLAGAGVAVQAAVQSQAQSQTRSEPEPGHGAAPEIESDAAPPASARLAAAEPLPHPSAPRSTDGDDLTRIKGLGPRLAAQLQGLGVTSFAQIAAWDEPEIDRIDAQLGRFQGRIRRDQWPEQARLLAAGDTAGYEDRFGKL